MFYERVKFLCDERGISMTKMTSDLGCSQSNVTRWKAGAAPRPKIIRAVADYFGVDVSYFTESSIQSSNIVQGINHSTVTITNGGTKTRELSEIETELLKICEKLDTRKKALLLAKAYEILESEEN